MHDRTMVNHEFLLTLASFTSIAYTKWYCFAEDILKFFKDTCGIWYCAVFNICTTVKKLSIFIKLKIFFPYYNQGIYYNKG